MDIPDDLGLFQADARKVKQIVYNLLSNAVKFTVEGGLVTLRARPVSRADVGALSGPWPGRGLPVADSAFTDFLRISVTDSGIGIAAAELERLFKPFSQIDSGLARKFEGTGLGLVIVQLMAELHGGAVAVESAVGEGSCFTVWLPLRPAEDGAGVPGKTLAPSGVTALPGARVALVVEDDLKSAELIRVQLEAEGFRVLHAPSAEAGLLLAAQQPVVLITLDIMLPDMDGWEFLGRLKQVPELTRIPVVIISILADRNRGFALGAAAVMQKPISRQELYESLVDLGLFPVAVGGALKVLVVDDDPKAADLIAVRIEGLASTVLRAYGGREAIDTARRELPDLIVLDLMMPDVSGFEVVEALNQQPDTAGIPILVVTGKRITAEERGRLNGYVTSIMEKAEFDTARLVTEVRRAMSAATRRSPEMATVLIIEDNAANMTLAIFLLTSGGHTVLTAVDAEAGLTLARTAQPDLILMDIQLPGMDGLAATALLKADEATRAIPVIALTALAMKGDEERIRAAGCDGYIAKPLAYRDFLALISEQLGAVL